MDILRDDGMDEHGIDWLNGCHLVGCRILLGGSCFCCHLDKWITPQKFDAISLIFCIHQLKIMLVNLNQLFNSLH
jgi:hypothetical protein